MTSHKPIESSQDKRVRVRHVQHGWEVVVLRDNDVVRTVKCTDWHRVERAIGRFEPVRDARDQDDRLIR